jgi:pyruvate dehydrogenase E2 component (dihydrolipoamide acetyltransferase)
MDIIMPQLGETVAEGSITTWYKKPGESIAADEPLFEVETDKVTTEIPSPVAGVVRQLLVDAGTTVKIGTRLAIVETASEAANTGAAEKMAPDAMPMREAAGATQKVTSRFAARAGGRLSPVVRRLLAQSGLSADEVQGSGRDGRITREDMLERINTGAPAARQSALDDQVVPLNKIRRATAAHMVRSIASSVHTLQAVEVDFQNVDRARAARGAEWKASEGFSLTYLPFVCAAICAALADFPHINSTFSHDALIVHPQINLGIAVDLGFEGLMVPVLKKAASKDVGGLARATHALVKKARANNLTVDDVSGGTYTLSNSGSFGTLITAPIINQPQVAILSLDGVHKKPVVIEGPDGDAIAVRPIGVLAQSFDHRAFDGAYSAAFLRRLKQVLETRNWLAELQ